MARKSKKRAASIQLAPIILAGDIILGKMGGASYLQQAAANPANAVANLPFVLNTTMNNAGWIILEVGGIAAYHMLRVSKHTQLFHVPRQIRISA